MNQYNPLIMKTRSIDESAGDRGNIYHDYLNYIEGLSEIKNISYMINCVLQKTNDNIFVVPFDAVFPDSDNGESLAQIVKQGSYFPLCTNRGIYTSRGC